LAQTVAQPPQAFGEFCNAFMAQPRILAIIIGKQSVSVYNTRRFKGRTPKWQLFYREQGTITKTTE